MAGDIHGDTKGDHFVADEQSLSAEVEGGPARVQLMGVDASLLGEFVEPVDGLGRSR